MLYGSERNYGCRFLEVSLHGLRTIILENEVLRTVILLDKGTDIIEFTHKPTDTGFIWRSPLGLSCLKQTPFLRRDDRFLLDSYTGGWFEAFPNVGGACSYKGAPIPEYGEVCSLPWEYRVLRDDPEEVSLLCYVRTIRTPFLLEKTFTVKTRDAALLIEEKATNLGRETMDFQWGHHPNFGSPFLDGDCLIDLPGGEANAYASLQNARVKTGASGQWPFLEGLDGQSVDFRKMPPKGAGVYDILFLSKLKGGWAAVRNTVKGIGIGLSWDASLFNNCLLWMVANGDPGYPRYGDTYALCVLPSNANVHTLEAGAKAGSVTTLKPGESRSTWLTATVFTQAQEVAGISRQGAVRFQNPQA